MAENPIFDTCQICKQDGQLTRELHSLMSRLPTCVKSALLTSYMLHAQYRFMLKRIDETAETLWEKHRTSDVMQLITNVPKTT